MTSIALVVVGLIAVAVSLWEAPASRIARQARLDHQRALAEAKSGGRLPRPLGGKSAVARSTVSSTPKTPVPTAWLPGQVAEIAIPALGTQAPVVAEGAEGSALVIPQDVHQVGWDRQSAPAGAPGVTLLAGHVNWVGQGEGALGQIGQLVPGDPIFVDWEGVRTVWRVVAWPRLVPNTVVHPSLFRRAGAATLALVTCGGPFTETAQGGSYADNVIVLAKEEG